MYHSVKSPEGCHYLGCVLRKSGWLLLHEKYGLINSFGRDAGGTYGCCTFVRCSVWDDAILAGKAFPGRKKGSKDLICCSWRCECKSLIPPRPSWKKNLYGILIKIDSGNFSIRGTTWAIYEGILWKTWKILGVCFWQCQGTPTHSGELYLFFRNRRLKVSSESRSRYCLLLKNVYATRRKYSLLELCSSKPLTCKNHISLLSLCSLRAWRRKFIHKSKLHTCTIPK